MELTVEEGDSATFHCKSSKREPVWKSESHPNLVYKSYKYTIKIALLEDEGYYHCRGVSEDDRKFVARAKLKVAGN